jgi:DNA-3-methyladenine glycosylase II
MTHLPYEAPTEAVIAAARAALAAADPALARADAVVAPFIWRLRAPGFAALLKLIVEQQVSVAAAAAIWGRMEAGLGTVTPETVLAQDQASLKAFGLSGQKAGYALAIAAAEAAGEIDFAGLRALGDEAATQALIRLKGVGRWTAETYLMFAEGRLDVFPAGDVALQQGLRMAEGGEVKPTQDELYARAEAWRPYRGVAAHLLWGYYAAMRRAAVAGS